MSRAETRARRATFDPSRQHLRGLIAKVHIAKAQLGLDEDTYRQILFDQTGHMSASDCDEVELEKVVRHFEARGFKPRVVAGKGKAVGAARRPADHAPARKARAMWISLYHLGAIDNPAERALEAFGARQLKVEALQWADQALCYKLIEALKAIAERHGWSQDMTGHYAKMDARGKIYALKHRLCEAIVAKLKAAGLAGKDWSLRAAAFRLCGLEYGPSLSVEDLDLCARRLGDKLRSHS